jgi:hypothetical protein
VDEGPRPHQRRLGVDDRPQHALRRLPHALDDGAPAGGFTNRTFFRCTFRNKSQWAPATVAAIGYGFTMERCAITGFGDCGQSICPTSAPDSAVRVKLLGCYLGELSFWWAPTKGLVHPSDDHSHSDCWQWQGGTGQWVEGCWIDAHYSTTVGTGTPNSGQDTAGIKASYAPYDQATGEAARYRIVDGGGTWATGPAAHTGGSLSGLMFSTSPAGHIANATTLNNWGSGGSNWLNAGDDALTGAFGTVQGQPCGQQPAAGRLGTQHRLPRLRDGR